MIRKIFKFVGTKDYTIRENMIINIMFLGLAIDAVAIVEELFVATSFYNLIPLLGIMVGLLLAMLLMFKFQKSEAAAILIGFSVVLVAFPSVFLLSGGIDGGSTVWFVLGIFYFIGMFNGRKMYAFTGITIIVDSIVYYTGYKYPEMINQMDSIEEVYFDSFFGVVLVGLLLGFVTKYQLRAYDRERQLALSQRDEIEKFSDSKNDFFASMSHEIRTPINTIIGLNEMILREEKISEETIENAVTIQNASKMLLSLVNDILDLSQIESKKMEIIPVEYKTTAFFSDLIDMIRIRLEEKELDFKVHVDRDFPSVLFGDDKRLKQVVLNLLTNAAKYTKQGSVTLEARVEKIGEEWCKVTISVSDTGVGIRSENLEALFNSFTRVENSDNRKIEGTGLGLSISKQLMELMGGQITVDSIYTKGSTFTVMLEQKIVNATPIGNVNFLGNIKHREIYKQKFEAPEARVLVVDDNDLNRTVITKLLKATKLQIDMADGGESCLEMTQKKYYDVILMDYMMPDMNGDEVTKLIRKQESGLCRQTPVIALTADVTFGKGGTLREMGFDEFVEKPIKSSELEEAILRHLPGDVIEYQLKTYDRESISRTEFKNVYKRRKVTITNDCVSDIPLELRDKYEIKTIYSYINTDGNRFCDTLEIDTTSLGRFLSDTEATAVAEAATIEDYEKFFAECLTEAEDVIHISLGKSMGDSYSNAVAAAKGFGHVHVIDSGNISCGMALVVLDAARMASRGGNVNEIIDEIDRVKNNIVSNFILPSSQIFYQNGYTDIITAKFVQLFRMHPVLKSRQSSLVISGLRFGKLSTARKRFVRQHIIWKKNSHGDICYITHAGLSVKEQEEIYNEVLAAGRFNRIIMEKSSVTNACFSGMGTIGIAFYVEK